MLKPVEFLQILESAGVIFAISMPDANGARSFIATPEDLLLFLQNRTAYYAKTMGVDITEYMTWVDEQFSVRCAAMTSKQRRCKNIVTGGVSVEAKIWVDMQGAYCATHDGSQSILGGPV